MGLIDGFDYSSLSDFFVQPEPLALTRFTVGRSPGKLNLRMLVAGRIDATMGDPARFIYQARTEGITYRISPAGCLPSPLPGYLLLPARHRLTKPIMTLVDSRIEDFQRDGKLAAIYAAYKVPYMDSDSLIANLSRQH